MTYVQPTPRPLFNGVRKRKMNYVNRALVYQRALCWNAWSKAYLRLPHGVKLFLVAIRSLTRSPEGFRGEWMLSAINPLMRVCERGVWWIGLVRLLPLTGTWFCYLGTRDLPYLFPLQLCFLVVVVGVSGVVVTCYSYVIPSLADSHPVVAVFWVVYGHYLLVNIVFHYYKGFLLGPGQPTKVRRMQDAQWGQGGRGEPERMPRCSDCVQWSGDAGMESRLHGGLR